MQEPRVHALGRELLDRRVELVEGRLGHSGSAQFLAHREVRVEAFELQVVGRRDLRGQRHAVVRIGADPMHAGVDLHVHGNRGVAADRSRGERSDGARGIQRRGQPVLHDVGHRGGRRL